MFHALKIQINYLIILVFVPLGNDDSHLQQWTFPVM